MRPEMGESKLAAIEARIEAIKKALQGIGEIRPGSLTRQNRATRGSYHQVSYMHKMKGKNSVCPPGVCPLDQKADLFL
jgi:hypothetical protein